MLTTTTKANLSQIFGLYPDPTGEAQTLLDEACRETDAGRGDRPPGRGQPPLAGDRCGHDRGGVGRDGPQADLHRRRPPPLRNGLQLPRHIYEAGFLSPGTSGQLRADDVRGDGRSGPDRHADAPAVPRPAGHDQRGTGRPSLAPCFTTRPAGEGPDQAATVWEDIETGGEQGTIGLFTQKDGRWTVAELTDAGRARMAEVAKEHTDEWRGLGVALLHRLLIDDLLGRQGSAQAAIRPPDRGSGRGAARPANSPWPPWSCRPRSSTFARSA